MQTSLPAFLHVFHFYRAAQHRHDLCVKHFFLFCNLNRFACSSLAYLSFCQCHASPYKRSRASPSFCRSSVFRYRTQPFIHQPISLLRQRDKLIRPKHYGSKHSCYVLPLVHFSNLVILNYCLCFHLAFFKV